MLPNMLMMLTPAMLRIHASITRSGVTHQTNVFCREAAGKRSAGGECVRRSGRAAASRNGRAF